MPPVPIQPSLHGYSGNLGILLTRPTMQGGSSGTTNKLILLLGEGGRHSMAKGVAAPGASLFTAVETGAAVGKMGRGLTSCCSSSFKQRMSLSENVFGSNAL